MARDRVVRRGSWVLEYLPMETGPEYRLFNIADDPDCANDVILQHPEIAHSMKCSLDFYLNSDRDRFERLTATSVEGNS
jgi:hypothetical protein